LDHEPVAVRTDILKRIGAFVGRLQYATKKEINRKKEKPKENITRNGSMDVKKKDKMR
jgi:hypothetical protein